MKKKQNTVRKDNRGQVLQKGESQRKDLVYQFRYTDIQGVRRSIYSSDLNELRLMEAEIERQSAEGVDYAMGNIGVVQLVERYLNMLHGKRKGTTDTYRFVLNVLQKDAFGKRKIRDVKKSEVKLWMISLAENRYKFSSIQMIKNVLRPAFEMACDDGFIQRNPVSFRLDFIQNDKTEGIALSAQQEVAFMDYIRGHRYYSAYCDEFTVLLGTGLRVSEFCGLTMRDLDFEARQIHVRRQLKVGKDGFYTEEPKTQAGSRTLPMSDAVYCSLKNILRKRKPQRIEYVVDGCAGFILLNQNNKPKTSRDIERVLRGICKNCSENIPRIVPHTFRHTFCTRLIMAGVDVKTVQYLMGHADITTTMNVYTHVDFAHVNCEFEKLIRYEKSTMGR